MHAWGQRREPVAAAQGPHRHLPAWARKEQLQGVRSARDPSSSSVLPTAKEPPGPPAAIAMLRSIPALPPPSLDTATEPGRQLVDSTTWSLRPPRWPMILGCTRATSASAMPPNCWPLRGYRSAAERRTGAHCAVLATVLDVWWAVGGREGGRGRKGEGEREGGREEERRSFGRAARNPHNNSVHLLPPSHSSSPPRFLSLRERSV